LNRNPKKISPRTSPSFKLIEAERFCADCEQEHNILDRSDPNKSHGDCRRHWIARMIRAGYTPEQVNDFLLELSPNAFCPDLGQPDVSKAG
jgi:predicted Ser/Thr protein kinase